MQFGEYGPVRQLPCVERLVVHFAVGSDLPDNVVARAPQVCFERRNAVDHCEKATDHLRGVERVWHAVRSGEGTIRPLT